MDENTLWKNWKTNPGENTLSPLLEVMDPTIMKRVNMFNTADVPKPVLTMAAKRLAVESFGSFDPKRASLKTHTYNYLKQLSRFVGDLQNTAHIPENRRIKITQYKQAIADLEERIGRDPNFQELSTELNWPLKEVQRMNSELRGTTISSTFDGDQAISKGSDRERRIVRNIYYELVGDEALVYEYLLGERGKKKMTEQEIAKKLNMSITKVSRIKHKIISKIDQYM